MATKRRPRRKTSAPRTRIRLTGWMLALCVIAFVAYLVSTARNPAPRPADTTPAEALEQVETPASLPQKMIRYRGFTVNFNPETHQPNYVVWELLADEATGSEPRNDQFANDPDIAASAWPQDYRYTGYDRGHMAPAGDMKWDAEAMRQSFLMTNICPQASELNRGAWKKLEEKCRLKAQADSALIIVCGPVFDNPDRPSMRLGNTGVAVPDRFFKVVLSPYTDPPQAIGFIMPNGPVPGGMQAAAVSVDSVETLTGYNFFSALPDDIEHPLESRCDFNRWSHLRRH